jgi:hypothetical protein
MIMTEAGDQRQSGATMREYSRVPTLGRATIDPAGDVVAGSYGTWTVTYTVGYHGMDDSARILIARRLASNWGIPQFDWPGEPEYTTAWTSGEARLRLHWDTDVYVRPWKRALVIDIRDGALAPGDVVKVTFGDTSAGGPGSRAQTFREETYEFRIAVDPFGNGVFDLAPDPPTLRIIGGPAARLCARAPSEVGAGEPFAVTVVAEDHLGNPSDGFQGTVQLVREGNVTILQAHEFQLEERGAHRFEGLTLPAPGVYRLLAQEEQGALQAASNPIVCQKVAPSLRLFWGDIHGQTESTVGTGTVDEYLAFGRDVAALDVVSHCANDLRVTAEHWRETKELIKRYHQPGRYVTFLAYEWSGPTPGGGDHNVYFLGDDGPLHRSSHGQVADISDIDTDRFPINKLHETLRGRGDVLVIPHIGGRHANLDYYDPDHCPLIEIASVHGVFEWFAEDALRRGFRVGFIASSDDHSGRQGAAYPTGTDIHFGMRGGLVGIYAKDLSREAIWEAFWARRCYGTTGERIILRLSADGSPMGSELLASRPPLLEVEVIGTAPLEMVELRRGLDIIYSHPLSEAEAEGRPLLKLVWEGARTKWRNRPTIWDGSLELVGGRILAAEPFAFDNPDQGILEQGETAVRWRSSTSGDPDGLFLDLDAPQEAVLSFETKPAAFSFSLVELDRGPLTVDAGGLGQRVTASWVPRGPRPTMVRFSYRDASAAQGAQAYWLRVIQRDGAMAWSSPIYVDFQAR